MNYKETKTTTQLHCNGLEAASGLSYKHTNDHGRPVVGLYSNAALVNKKRIDQFDSGHPSACS